MNRLIRIFSGLREFGGLGNVFILPDRLARLHQAAPETHLRVSNLTRHTVLASFMEIADKGKKRRKGLLGRELLNPGEGIWIIPCEAVHTFGMQFPIDLVYLDRNNRIKKLRSDIPPWRLSACFSAHSVLELAQGTIHSTQTRTGDTLEFSAAIPPAKSSGVGT